MRIGKWTPNALLQVGRISSRTDFCKESLRANTLLWVDGVIPWIEYGALYNITIIIALAPSYRVSIKILDHNLLWKEYPL